MVIGLFGASAIAEKLDVSRSISLQAQAIREKIKSELKPVSKETAKTSTPAEPEVPVLVAKVVIKTPKGQPALPSDLEQKAYDIIATKPGGTVTRTQLQADISAIFATGYFSNAQAEPEDTDIGVRVTFFLLPNPVLKSVTTQGTQVLEQNVVNHIFGSQIGKITNLKNIQVGVKELEKYYTDKGYVLAQVIDIKATPEGNINLVISEGAIESIHYAFINEEGKTVNKDGTPVVGSTTIANLINKYIVRKLKTKPRQAFNKNTVQLDLQNLYSLGLLEDLNIGLAPGTDPRKVIVTINVREKEFISLLSWSVGISNKTGAFTEIEYERPLIKSADTNNPQLIELLDELDRLDYEAVKLAKSDAIDSKMQALKIYRECLILAKAKKDLKIEFHVLFKIGRIYQSLNFLDKAIDFYNLAFTLAYLNELAIFGKSDNLAFYISIFPATQSSSYQSLGEYQQALILLSQVQSSLKKNYVGLLQNDNKSKIALFQALYHMQKAGFYYDLGEKELFHKNRQISIDLFRELFLKTRENLNKPKPSVNKNNIQISSENIQKSIFSVNENLQASIDSSNENFSIKKGEERSSVDEVLQLITSFFLGVNIDDPFQDSITTIKSNKKLDLDNSVRFSEATLKISLNQPLDKDKISDKYLSLKPIFGKQYLEIGENEISLNYFYQSLKDLEANLKKLAKENLSPSDNINTSLQESLQGIGDALSNLDKKLEAIKYYKKAISISNNPKSKAIIFGKIGKIQQDLGQFNQSIQSFNESLLISRKTANLKEEADSHLEIAIIERARNNLARSITQIETAIKIIESEPLPLDIPIQDTSLSNRKQFKSYVDLASYFTARKKFYDFYIDLLMQLHKQNPNNVHQQQALQVSEQSRGRSLLALFNSSNRNDSNSIRSNTDKRVKGLERTLKLSEIQQQILDNDSVLLEYSLGEERSYLFVVSKTDIQSYELSKRSDIEDSARNFYNFLTVPSLRVRSTKAAKAGQELSQMLLGAAANRIANKRLLIVADGILQYIPFSALPSPTLNPDKQALSDSLISQHEIVMLPSASVFAALRKNKPSDLSPSKTLLIFADPVFGYADDRMVSKSSQPQSTKKQLPLADGSQPLLDEIRVEQLYPRLPSTQIEADQISSLLPATNVTQLTGSAASRQAAIDPAVVQYRIIHFATHGTLDTKFPERSGMVLSLLNESGDLQQRSLLSTPDVFNLKLSADLVVLSGCRTGLGKEINGEGLIGLTGGFMYAGAKSVVVSLWSVDDAATAELMKLFYKGMLQDKLPASQALRKAQLEIRKDPRWQNPFYWAGFILQGEWK